MRLRYLTRPLPPKAPPTALLALCSQEAGTFPLCSLPSSFLAPCTQSPHVHVSLFLIQGEPFSDPGRAKRAVASLSASMFRAVEESPSLNAKQGVIPCTWML